MIAAAVNAGAGAETLATLRWTLGSATTTTTTITITITTTMTTTMTTTTIHTSTRREQLLVRTPPRGCHLAQAG